MESLVSGKKKMGPPRAQCVREPWHHPNSSRERSQTNGYLNNVLNPYAPQGLYPCWFLFMTSLDIVGPLDSMEVSALRSPPWGDSPDLAI